MTWPVAMDVEFCNHSLCLCTQWLCILTWCICWASSSLETMYSITPVTFIWINSLILAMLSMLRIPFIIQADELFLANAVLYLICKFWCGFVMWFHCKLLLLWSRIQFCGKLVQNWKIFFKLKLGLVYVKKWTVMTFASSELFWRQLNFLQCLWRNH